MESVKVIKQEKNGARLKIDFEVGQEDLEPAFNEILESMKKQANIKGFRPGKAPVKLVEQKYGQRADSLLLDEFIPQVIQWFNEENSYRNIDTPRVDLQDYSRKEKLLFSAEYDIYPGVTLPNYQKVSIKEDYIKVEESDIKKELDAIQNKHAELRPREGKAYKGDEIALQVTVQDPEDGDKVLEENKMMKTILGKNDHLPDLDKGLTDITLNEERSFMVKYPKDFEHAELQNRKLLFKIIAKEVNEVVLPELDDELAKDENFASFSEMKEKIEQSLEEYGSNYLEQENKTRVINKLTEQTKTDIPESLLDSEVHSIVHNMGHQIGKHIEKLEELEKELGPKEGPKMADEIKKQAELNTKKVLMLMEIAKTENIQVSAEELDERIAQLALQYRMDKDELRKQLEENRRLNSIAHEILIDKTVDFVYSNGEKKKGKQIKLSELSNKRD